MISLIALATSLLSAPSDPFFSLQWNLHNDGSQIVNQDQDSLHVIHQQGIEGVDIGWLEAKDDIAQKSNAPVIVAVIDSGIDLTHPELKDRITADGFDFLTNKPLSIDDSGHGTHVSGIIAANSDNHLGIAGLAPAAVKILPLRVLSKTGYSNFIYRGRLLSDYVADAVRYAVAHHASVINLSLGWPKVVDNDNARAAFKSAIDAGILVVAAAGNDHKDEPTYPCAYQGVLCVGSIMNNGETALYSNFGGQVDLLAPGDGIVSLYPQSLESSSLRIQGYERMSGTSQAAPHIAALGAILKSAFPNLSLLELKSRIFNASKGQRVPNNALYGTPKIKTSFETPTTPIYQPEWKDQLSQTISEDNFTAAGDFTILNLGATANQVQVTVSSQNQLMGNANIDQLENGARLPVHWVSPFSSLDQSSNLPITVTIKDAFGSREFSTRLTLVRASTKIKAQTILSLPKNHPAGRLDWFTTTNGHLFPNLKPLNTYATHSGTPVYGHLVGPNPNGSSVQVFDPSRSDSVHLIQVPFVQAIEQVMRIDLNGDGNQDWVITGKFQTPNDLIFQFFFLNQNFEPLFGDASVWQVSMNSTFGANIDRDYSKVGSWLNVDGKLVPAFISPGPLPKQDNFDSLDPRHFSDAETHLFYLKPTLNSDGSPRAGVQALEIRALDSARFRQDYPEFKILSVLPVDTKDQLAGHLRILTIQGSGLDAPIALWDIRSNVDHDLNFDSGWNAFASSGQIVRTLPGESAASINFFDQKSGSITWANGAGNFVSRSEFFYQSSQDPVTGLKGVFDLGSSGQFTFLISSFNLIAQYADLTQTLPLNRDSSFASQIFSDLLTPVLAGTVAHPLPGIFVDSTLIQGDRVSVATINPLTRQFDKTLRYSFSIPGNCIALSPYQQAKSNNYFALPLLCQSGDQIEYRILEP